MKKIGQKKKVPRPGKKYIPEYVLFLKPEKEI